MKTLAFLVATLVAAASAHAQDKTADIDKIFSWVTPESPGCAVSASHRGKPVLSRAYGVADLDRKAPITADTIFDAGSVVKQFVAASVLLLVEEKRLSLTDDIRKYIPELPDPGHTVTIDHLLTHTSGVRDWTGIVPFAAGTPDALAITLRQRGLNFPPGEEFAYSNGGYVLLKELVARVAKMPFGEFAQKRLFAPLGLKATRYLLDTSEIAKNMAIAYEKRGNTWTPDMLLGNARGGGGALFTTAADLRIWMDALMTGKLGTFVTRKIQEPGTLKNGQRLDYARGLMLQDNGLRIIWHSGSAAAYKTIVGHFPDHQFTIAIMCNAGESADARTRFAGQIFDIFLPGARAAATAAAKPTPAPAAKPSATPLGQGPSPQSPGRGAQPYALAAADLQAFVGRFESQEMGSTFQIAAATNGLVLSLEHMPVRRIDLTPIAPDTFQRGGIVVRFVRDKVGKVSGLDFTNPVNRNIRFTRKP